MNTVYALVDASIGVFLIVGVAALLNSGLHRVMSASTRHAMWAASILCVLILPLIMPLVPSHPIAVATAYLPAFGGRQTTPMYETQAASDPLATVGALPDTSTKANHGAALAERQYADPSPFLSENATRISEPIAGSQGFDLGRVVLAIWAFGTALVAIRLIVSISLVRQILRFFPLRPGAGQPRNLCWQLLPQAAYVRFTWLHKSV